jgi:hypothetical protein
MSNEFPEIPSKDELMREADAFQAGAELDHLASGTENQVAEPNGNGQYNEVEQFRANPPYMQQPEYKPYEQSDRFAELKKAYTDLPLEQRRRPVFDTHHGTQVVELSPLLQAYARFSSEQTMFLEAGPNMTGDQYQQALRRYSREQTLLIRAQAEALRQAGVL